MFLCQIKFEYFLFSIILTVITCSGTSDVMLVKGSEYKKTQQNQCTLSFGLLQLSTKQICVVYFLVAVVGRYPPAAWLRAGIEKTLIDYHKYSTHLHVISTFSHDISLIVRSL